MSTDESDDKTDEIREAVGEDGALGGTTDGDDGAVLTLDGDSDSSDRADESEGESGGEDS